MVLRFSSNVINSGPSRVSVVLASLGGRLVLSQPLQSRLCFSWPGCDSRGPLCGRCVCGDEPASPAFPGRRGDVPDARALSLMAPLTPLAGFPGSASACPARPLRSCPAAAPLLLSGAATPGWCGISTFDIFSCILKPNHLPRAYYLHIQLFIST